MPHKASKPAPLATGTGLGIVQSLPACGSDLTATPFDPQSYAPAWLARRARVPLHLAGLLAALACIGGGI